MRTRTGCSASVSRGGSSSPEAAARFGASRHAGSSSATGGHLSKEEELEVISAIQVRMQRSLTVPLLLAESGQGVQATR